MPKRSRVWRLGKGFGALNKKSRVLMLEFCRCVKDWVGQGVKYIACSECGNKRKVQVSERRGEGEMG